MADFNLQEFIDQLDEKIRFHGIELEKHMNTREILFRSIRAPHKPQPQLEHAGKKRRKRTGPPVSPQPEVWKAVRETVLIQLMAVEDKTLTARDFIHAVLGEPPYEKRERDRVYGVLKELRDQRRIVLEEDRTYSLVDRRNAA